MAATHFSYQFFAEPITTIAGKLLGVQLHTRLFKEGQQVHYPELVIKTWPAQEKRHFLCEQLSCITQHAAWFLQRGVCVSLPLYDEESAALIGHDPELRQAISSLPFVRLELCESISEVRNEIRGISNSLWLSDLGRGDCHVSGLVDNDYEAVMLDRQFFNDEVYKPTFLLLIKNLRRYCERIIVNGLKDRKVIPLLAEAEIYGVQGLCRAVPLNKVQTLM